MPLLNLTSDTCAKIYAGVAFATLFICVIRSTVYYYMVLRISRRLHELMFSAVVGAPMRFFDTNPSGTKVNKVDCKLDFYHFIQCLFRIFALQVVF